MDLENLVSVDRRRQRWRLRPITLVIAGVALLLVVGGLVWGISTVSRATGIRPPAAVPAAADTASSPAAETVGAELYPITWTVRLARDESGRLVGVMDDPAVMEAVERSFLDAWEWAFTSAVPHNPGDVERYFAPLPEGVDDGAFRPDPVWWYGLAAAEEDLQRESTQGLLRRSVLEGGSWNVEVARFSTDGSRAVVAARYEGACRIEFYDIATGELVGGHGGECLTYVTGMVYDTQDGRWKIAVLRQFRSE
ncbi:MAG TPA: hypothetical protein ENI39_04755 [Anaerolineae bacterium]|nr:hypothetical protein [Anaerolineae bacterium]